MTSECVDHALRLGWSQNGSPATWLAAEIERLRAIVDRLPKTADVVPVIPWDCEVFSYVGVEIRSSKMLIFENGEWFARFGGYRFVEVSQCYSTRAAAEKARTTCTT